MSSCLLLSKATNLVVDGKVPTNSQKPRPDPMGANPNWRRHPARRTSGSNVDEAGLKLFRALCASHVGGSNRSGFGPSVSDLRPGRPTSDPCFMFPNSRRTGVLDSRHPTHPSNPSRVLDFNFQDVTIFLGMEILVRHSSPTNLAVKLVVSARCPRYHSLPSPRAGRSLIHVSLSKNRGDSCSKCLIHTQRSLELAAWTGACGMVIVDNRRLVKQTCYLTQHKNGHAFRFIELILVSTSSRSN